MTKSIEDFDYDEEFMEKVFKQQESIRSSGITNMFNIRKVREIAEEADHEELAYFIKNTSSSDYMDMANKAAEEYRPE